MLCKRSMITKYSENCSYRKIWTVPVGSVYEGLLRIISFMVKLVKNGCHDGRVPWRLSRNWHANTSGTRTMASTSGMRLPWKSYGQHVCKRNESLILCHKASNLSARQGCWPSRLSTQRVAWSLMHPALPNHPGSQVTFPT